MAFNLKPFGKIVNNLMYGDKCTISRLGTSKDKYGASNPGERTAVYENISCKFSFNQVDAPGDGNDVYVPILKEVKVFMDLNYNVKAGDFITGYRIDEPSEVSQLIEGICGEPNRFDYHQEIPIIIDKEN